MSAASSELLLSQDYGRGSLSARSRDGTGGWTNGQPVFWSRVCPRPIGSRFSTPGLQPQWNRKWQTSFPTGNFLTSNLFDLNSRVLYLHQETLYNNNNKNAKERKSYSGNFLPVSSVTFLRDLLKGEPEFSKFKLHLSPFVIIQIIRTILSL